jgi:hypothetical protein
LYKLVDWSGHETLREKVAAAEESIYHNEADPLVNWDEGDLEKALENAAGQISLTVETSVEQRRIANAMMKRWFDANNPYYQALAATGLAQNDLQKIQSIYRTQFENHVVAWSSQIAYVALKT